MKPKQLECKRCGYEWWPRNPEAPPKMCPACKSRKYTEEKSK